MDYDFSLSKYFENRYKDLKHNKNPQLLQEDVLETNYLDLAIQFIKHLHQSLISYDKGILVLNDVSRPVFIDDQEFDFLARLLPFFDSHKQVDTAELLAHGYLLEFLALYRYALKQDAYIKEKQYSDFKGMFCRRFDKYIQSGEKVITKYYRLIFLDNEISIPVFLPSHLQRFTNVAKEIKVDHSFAKEIYLFFANQKLFLNEIYDITPIIHRRDEDIRCIYSNYLENKNCYEKNDIFLLIKLRNNLTPIKRTQLEKKIINHLVDEANDIIHQPKPFVQFLVETEELTQKLYIFHQYYKNKKNNSYIIKIDEISRSLLANKRKRILNFDENDESSMQSISFSIPIDPKEQRELQSSLEESIFNVYGYLFSDFKSLMKETIHRRDKHPTSYLLEHFTYDTSQGMYQSTRKIEKKSSSAYSIYFEQYGLALQEKMMNEEVPSHEKIVNRYKDGFYNSFVDVFKNKLQFTLTTISSVLDEQHLINLIFKKLSEVVTAPNLMERTTPLHNSQILSTFLVLVCENILSKALEGTRSIEKKLEEEFKKETSYREYIFFIYFVLYAEEGYEIRNHTVHGDYLGKSYYSELLLLVGCLVASAKVSRGVESHEI